MLVHGYASGITLLLEEKLPASRPAVEAHFSCSLEQLLRPEPPAGLQSKHLYLFTLWGKAKKLASYYYDGYQPQEQALSPGEVLRLFAHHLLASSPQAVVVTVDELSPEYSQEGDLLREATINADRLFSLAKVPGEDRVLTILLAEEPTLLALEEEAPSEEEPAPEAATVWFLSERVSGYELLHELLPEDYLRLSERLFPGAQSYYGAWETLLSRALAETIIVADEDFDSRGDLDEG